MWVPESVVVEVFEWFIIYLVILDKINLIKSFIFRNG
jgi:hypothetical protein